MNQAAPPLAPTHCLLAAQGKFTEAETVLHRSLVMEEKTLGAEHPVVASSLNHLAALFKSQVRTLLVKSIPLA